MTNRIISVAGLCMVRLTIAALLFLDIVFVVSVMLWGLPREVVPTADDSGFDLVPIPPGFYFTVAFFIAAPFVLMVVESRLRRRLRERPSGR